MVLCVPFWWAFPGLIRTCWQVLSWSLQGSPLQDYRALSPSNLLLFCSPSSPECCPAVPASTASRIFNSVSSLEGEPQALIGLPLPAVWPGNIFRVASEGNHQARFICSCFPRITALRCLQSYIWRWLLFSFLSCFIWLLMWKGKSSPRDYIMVRSRNSTYAIFFYCGKIYIT